MHPSRNIIPRSSITGMTLVEIMVSMAIGVVVIGTATWFLFEGTKASYKAMASTENSIQQWSLAAKLQIDGKIANRITIFSSADQATWVAGLPVEVGVDDGNPVNGLERGKILVLTKSDLVQGVDSRIVTDLIFYLYTGNSISYTGTLKRYPKGAPATFPISAAMAKDASNNPLSVAQIVAANWATLTGSNSELVQEHLSSVATNGPFGHFGSVDNASITLVREENSIGSVKNTNLTEVSFNLR